MHVGGFGNKSRRMLLGDQSTQALSHKKKIKKDVDINIKRGGIYPQNADIHIHPRSIPYSNSNKIPFRNMATQFYLPAPLPRPSVSLPAVSTTFSITPLKLKRSVPFHPIYRACGTGV